MQNLGIVTFNDNIDSIIRARQCISSNNIIVFVKEEHERDIQRCNKGTDVHIKFLREIEDYRGKLDMLMFLSAPVNFIYSKVSIAPKIAVTNNVLLQLGNYKIESTMQIGNHMFLVIEPIAIAEIKPIPVVIIEPPKPEPIVEIVETKQEIEVITETPVLIPKPIIEPIIEQMAEPVIEPVAVEEVKEIVIELPVETVIAPEPIIEVKEEIKIEPKKEEPKEEKRFAKSKRGRK